MKTLSIFGSTGSVGKKVFEFALANNFEILAITGNSNHCELIRQARLCRPKFVCVADRESCKIVQEALAADEIDVVGSEEISNIARLNVDIGVMAIAGNAGILPTFAMLGNAKRLAIATKEVIVSGGFFLLGKARQSQTEIIPIDSEHNSLFQCLQGEKTTDISKLIITASGGPFVDFSEKQLERVALADALKHPNWLMGHKITIDSATLFNKALEIIEAAYLFSVPIRKIVPLIHKDSVIHAMTQFNDGAFKASIYSPDMKFPIAYALSYPDRICCPTKVLDFSEITCLSFQKPQDWQKRNMDMAYAAFEANKVIAFNASNAAAVVAFLRGQTGFQDIFKLVSKCLEKSTEEHINSVDDILHTIEETQCQIFSGPLAIQ